MRGRRGPVAAAAREYDGYNRVSGLDLVGKAVFGNQYRGQKSSLWPDDLIDVVRRAGVGPETVVLDAGCGTGWAALTLVDAFGCRCEAWDISTSNVDQARALAVDEPRVLVRHRDMSDADGMAGSFDVIVSIGSLYWSDEPNTLAWSWTKLLRPTGTVVAFITQMLDAHDDVVVLPGASPRAARCNWPETFQNAGFDVTATDRTDRFSSWLSAWQRELDTHASSLIAEMGPAAFAAFRERFRTMHQSVEDGLLMRIELIARRTGGKTG